MRRLLVLVAFGALLTAPATSAMPPDAGGAEQRVRGYIEVVHGDDFTAAATRPVTDSSHRLPDTRFLLAASDASYELDFDGEPPAMAAGDEVEVAGRADNGRFRVREMRTVSASDGRGGNAAAAGGKGGGGGRKPPPPPPSYVGPRDVLAISFNFASSPSALPFTTEQIRGAGFTEPQSVAAYFSEASFGQTTLRGKNDGTSADRDALPGDVAGPFTLSSSVATCGYNTWASDARAAAQAAGWDLTGYEHITYIFPRQESCAWGGLGSIGGQNAWLNGTIAVGTWAHELGHNLTLYHSRTLICTANGVGVSVAGGCDYAEYGDPFDVMGYSSGRRHLHGRNKGHLGWFGAANVVTPSSGQSYTLSALESSATGAQVLRIPRSTKDFVYVELRTVHGFDSFGPADDVVTGVLIHTGPDLATNGNSYLIDTAPYSASFNDAALQAGQAFVDTVGGVYVETLSVSAGSASVLVRTGYTGSAPVASAAAGGQSVLVGLPRQHPGGSATDADKDLASYRWGFASCPGTCPAMTANETGSLAGGNASVPGPSYTPTTSGTYRLTLTVFDAAGRSSSASSEDVVGLL